MSNADIKIPHGYKRVTGQAQKGDGPLYEGRYFLKRHCDGRLLKL